MAFAVNFEPFYIRYNQKTVTQGTMYSSFLGGSGHRSSDVEADLFGIQVALEGATPLAGALSLIGRASAGIYHVRGDGRFNSRLTRGANQRTREITVAASLEDDSSQAGYRLGAETGLRYALAPSAWISVTGSVDYLSDVATAVLPRNIGDPAAHVGFDDLLDWRIGARLTIANN